jgi:hypothetical protein
MARSTVSSLTAALALALALAPRTAQAGRPYVTLVDDGTVAKDPFMTSSDELVVQDKVLALYAKSGFPLPQIMSVWTTFPLGGGAVSTFFDPLANATKGIGLDAAYGGDGTFASTNPPLQSILFHNDVLQLSQRAALQGAPLAGFARYLFLLELSHNWGPALNVPGTTPTELVGFPFHWSFWMDAGGSPAGGNVWTDNGDGTFTAVPANPATLAYSTLDLYIMGLVPASDVQPFGVLENVTAPAGVTDPLWGGAYAAHSFPWFSSSAFTATATRRVLTIQDIVTTNGARSPAAGTAPTSFTLGIVLLVAATDSPAAIAAAQQTFDPVAASFAPAFRDATGQRGTLVVVTEEADDAGAGDAGNDDAGAGGAGGTGGAPPSAAATGGGGTHAAAPAKVGCACQLGADTPVESPAAIVLAFTLASDLLRRRRLRTRRDATSSRWAAGGPR